MLRDDVQDVRQRGGGKGKKDPKGHNNSKQLCDALRHNTRHFHIRPRAVVFVRDTEETEEVKTPGESHRTYTHPRYPPSNVIHQMAKGEKRTLSHAHDQHANIQHIGFSFILHLRNLKKGPQIASTSHVPQDASPTLSLVWSPDSRTSVCVCVCACISSVLLIVPTYRCIVSAASQ